MLFRLLAGASLCAGGVPGACNKITVIKPAFFIATGIALLTITVVILLLSRQLKKYKAQNDAKKKKKTKLLMLSSVISIIIAFGAYYYIAHPIRTARDDAREGAKRCAQQPRRRTGDFSSRISCEY